MLFSDGIYVLGFLAIYTNLIKADDLNVPIAIELSIADDHSELCNKQSKETSRKEIQNSNTSLCFGSLKDATSRHLFRRVMFMSFDLNNTTLLVKLRIRRVQIFSPGATFKIAGGRTVPVFRMMKDLQLGHNFNGDGKVSESARNSSVIFKGQLNAVVFEGQIIYQDMDRRHSILCVHNNNALGPTFFEKDSCLKCSVSTFDSRLQAATIFTDSRRRSDRIKPLCKNGKANIINRKRVNSDQLAVDQTTKGDDNDSSGFPRTGFSDYEIDTAEGVKQSAYSKPSLPGRNTRSVDSSKTLIKVRNNRVVLQRKGETSTNGKTTEINGKKDSVVTDPSRLLHHRAADAHNKMKRDKNDQLAKRTLEPASMNGDKTAVVSGHGYRVKELKSNQNSPRKQQFGGRNGTTNSSVSLRQKTKVLVQTLLRAQNFTRRRADNLSKTINAKSTVALSKVFQISKKKRSVTPTRKETVKHAAYSVSQKPERSRRIDKRSENFKETLSCSLHLVADHLFFNEIGDRSPAKTVNLMLSVIIGADAVFRATDFNGDGVADNIGFLVKNITIINNSSAAFYKYSPTNGNSLQYLRSFSTADFSDVCLGVAFTAIDFDRGVVGLAWYASSVSDGAGKGGICGQRVYLPNEGSSFSFNTAIVSFINHGRSVSMEKAILTMAHEFGHCFGSSHDDMSGSACNRQYPQGTYLMQKFRPSEYFPNNYKFSPCSLRQMYPVIARKGKRCLTRYFGPTCGNGVLEEGEECDCGMKGVCHFNDPCCTPGDAPPSSPDRPCTVRRSEGMDCSPVTFACCSDACKHFQPGLHYLCREASDCYDQARCDGYSPLCPASVTRPDGTLCHGGTRVCVKGRCGDSLCARARLQDCFCSELKEDLCKLCCRDQQAGRCLPATLFNITSASGEAVYLPEGDSCLDYSGVCTSSRSTDTKRYCVAVSSFDQEFSALIGLPMTGSRLEGTSRLYNSWFYFLLIPFVLCLMLAAVLRGPCFFKGLRQPDTVHANVRLLDLISVAQSRSDILRREACEASALCDRICSHVKVQGQRRLQMIRAGARPYPIAHKSGWQGCRVKELGPHYTGNARLPGRGIRTNYNRAHSLPRLSYVKTADSSSSMYDERKRHPISQTFSVRDKIRRYPSLPSDLADEGESLAPFADSRYAGWKQSGNYSRYGEQRIPSKRMFASARTARPCDKTGHNILFAGDPRLESQSSLYSGLIVPLVKEKDTLSSSGSESQMSDMTLILQTVTSKSSLLQPSSPSSSSGLLCYYSGIHTPIAKGNHPEALGLDCNRPCSSALPSSLELQPVVPVSWTALNAADVHVKTSTVQLVSSSLLSSLLPASSPSNQDVTTFSLLSTNSPSHQDVTTFSLLSTNSPSHQDVTTFSVLSTSSPSHEDVTTFSLLSTSSASHQDMTTFSLLSTSSASLHEASAFGFPQPAISPSQLDILTCDLQSDPRTGLRPTVSLDSHLTNAPDTSEWSEVS